LASGIFLSLFDGSTWLIVTMVLTGLAISMATVGINTPRIPAFQLAKIVGQNKQMGISRDLKFAGNATRYFGLHGC